MYRSGILVRIRSIWFQHRPTSWIEKKTCSKPLEFDTSKTDEVTSGIDVAIHAFSLKAFFCSDVQVGLREHKIYIPILYTYTLDGLLIFLASSV